MRESYQQLQLAITAINGAIEEIRQLRADLTAGTEAGSEEDVDH